ncbi:MAG: GFA family protein [Hyphomicrobiaceae bacterium]|nr:GFA family protein [Hyphomicrobiaceae bacterium]
MSGTLTEQTMTGGCQCGAVRYEASGPPLEIYVCHCTECRKQSASAFGISVIVHSTGVRLVHGTPVRWSRLADSGRTVDCFFCPECGSRLWHGDKERAETISIKGGSLDEPPEITSAVHIWTNSKLAGVTIPDQATRFCKEPE